MLKICFPIISEDKKQYSSMLVGVNLQIGAPAGIYINGVAATSGLLPTERKAKEGLLEFAAKFPVNLVPYGSELDLSQLKGDSFYGALSFICQYDCANSPSNLQIAISIGSDFAKKISSEQEKIKLCIDENIDFLVLPDANRKEVPADINVLELSKPENLAEINKFQILLAESNWMETLARSLGLSKFAINETYSQTPIINSAPKLYDMFIEAMLSEDEENRSILAKVFEGSVYDKPLEANTFPYRLFYPEGDSPVEENLFIKDKNRKEPHVILCGPTSTGKTSMASAFLLNALANGQKAVYIAPTRALVYEVYDNFRYLFAFLENKAQTSPEFYMLFRRIFPAVSQNDLICSTGERSEQDNQILRGAYRIIFSVYEKANIFMNLMLDKATDKTPALVVIDELHMLLHPERGGIVDLFIAKSQDIKTPARIVGITTETTGSQPMLEFLGRKRKDPLKGRDKENAVLLKLNKRPVPVRHYLQYGKFRQEIAELGENELPALPKSVRGGILANLCHNDTLPAADIDNQKRSGSKDELMDGEFDFTTWLDEDSFGHKKIIGVFKSIEAIYKVVEKLSDKRLGCLALPWKDDLEENDFNSEDKLKFCSRKILEKIHQELKRSFITDEERDKLWKGAQAGIFAYYSPMEYKLREIMADAFKEEADYIQVLLATNALAYGVNLPADAIWLTSLRDIDDELISHNEFFNILGRVGRLGMVAKGVTPCAYILPCGDGSFHGLKEEELSCALQYYDGSEQEFISWTIAEKDYEKLCDNAVHRLSDLSLPTFRNVLDALRFVNRQKGHEDNGTAPYHVREHFQKSFFGWLVKKEYKDTKDFDLWLDTIYSVIADAKSFSENELVKTSDDSSGSVNYTCTELASALIDTGTSWKAIEPMTAWLVKIKPIAEFLPVELMLAGILAVRELWNSVRRFDQQSHKADIFAISEESREFADSSLAGEIERLDSRLETSRIMKLIDEFLEENCKNLELRDKRQNSSSLDPDVRRNSFYRLLAAFLRWARGANANEIKELAAPVKGRQDFSRGFSQNYGDMASWLCVLCLRFFSRVKSRLLHPRHEGSLQTFALRLRYGVPEACVPFMGIGANRKNRSEVMHYYTTNQITPKIALQYNYEDYRKIAKANYADSITYKEVGELVQQYYAREAKDFCEILSRGSNTENSIWKAIKNIFDCPFEKSLPEVLELLKDIPGKNFTVDIREGRGLRIKELHFHGSPLYMDFLDSSLVETEEEGKLLEHLQELTDRKIDRICVWYPWKRGSTIASPLHPTLSFIGSIFLLRMIEQGNHLQNIRDWLEKQKKGSKKIFRIQDLVSTTPTYSIHELRDMAGAILQGALQVSEPLFEEMEVAR